MLTSRSSRVRATRSGESGGGSSLDRSRSPGPEATNQKLSEKRAQVVLQFLIDGGISPARLTAIGYGESKPIATNMYKDGRQKNRRVEINLAQ